MTRTEFLFKDQFKTLQMFCKERSADSLREGIFMCKVMILEQAISPIPMRIRKMLCHSKGMLDTKTLDRPCST
jgi:hypothetical protein